LKDPHEISNTAVSLEASFSANILLDGNPLGDIQYTLKARVVLKSGNVVVDKR